MFQASKIYCVNCAPTCDAANTSASADAASIFDIGKPVVDCRNENRRESNENARERLRRETKSQQPTCAVSRVDLDANHQRRLLRARRTAQKQQQTKTRFC
jgi:hypothetical protein